MCNCPENNPCGQQPCLPLENCDCPVKDLKSDCIIVTKDLPCAEIEAGQTLTETFEQMDAHVCEVKSELEQTIAYTTTIKNVGDGKRVFKGVDGLGRRELRTLKEDDNLITVTENTDTINIGVNETNLIPFIQNNQKTYDINNVGTGAKIYQEPDPTPVGNLSTFNIKSLKSSNSSVTINETATELDITVPIVTPPDGSETKINAGANITVTGSGTLVSPYIVSASSVSVDGSETKINNGVTTTVTGNGTLATPYVVETNNLQKEVSTFPYTLISSDNNYVIYVNNSTNNVTINVPNGLPSNFEVGFIQEGTGDVTFSPIGTTLNNKESHFKIEKQFAQVFLLQKSNSNTYTLLGNTKL